jgi:hypothetical protein
MAEYPYTLKTGSLTKFFDHIVRAGVPDKVTIKYLESAGFKSTNDRSIMAVLKFIKFLDESGTPTENYINYRDKSKSRIILAQAIRASYPELFGIHPNANRKDLEALRDFFRPKTNAGEKVLNSIVSTFRALCELADFEAGPIQALQAIEKPVESKPTKATFEVAPTTLNINIQLALPVTENSEIYDKIFASLKKNLLTKD